MKDKKEMSPERRQYLKKYREEHREYFRIKSMEWYKNNSEKARAARINWYRKNRETIGAKNKARRNEALKRIREEKRGAK